MKARFEVQGIHFYDRVTGVHVLADEHPVPAGLCSPAPSVVSIALTNACNLSCDFCYAPKTQHSLDSEAVFSWCQVLDSLGTFEVALGGGEPTLYPYLPALCNKIWQRTNLGVSITTNGHSLTQKLMSELVGSLSIIRFSVDSVEPMYSKLRKRPLSVVLEAIRNMKERVPVGINTVVNDLTLKTLDQMLALVKENEIADWLLLPQTDGGQFTLSAPSWSLLERWISQHWIEVNLRISSGARRFIDCPFLFDSDNPRDYAHISADGYLHKSSYDDREGVSLHEHGVQQALNILWNGVSDVVSA